MELIIATRNRGKFREIEEALGDFPMVLRFLGDLKGAPPLEEDRPSFQENALKKARIISHWASKPALADDSGLVVPSLGGQPGIHSARYAGPTATDEENRGKLLQAIQVIPGEERGAHFFCALAVATPEGRELTVEARLEGLILSELRGSMGFGYDPLFYLPSLKKTLAELPLEEKNKISHRGQAILKLSELLPGFLKKA